MDLKLLTTVYRKISYNIFVFYGKWIPPQFFTTSFKFSSRPATNEVITINDKVVMNNQNLITNDYLFMILGNVVFLERPLLRPYTKIDHLPGIN